MRSEVSVDTYFMKSVVGRRTTVISVFACPGLFNIKMNFVATDVFEDRVYRCWWQITTQDVFAFLYFRLRHSQGLECQYRSLLYFMSSLFRVVTFLSANVGQLHLRLLRCLDMCMPRLLQAVVSNKQPTSRSVFFVFLFIVFLELDIYKRLQVGGDKLVYDKDSHNDNDGHQP